MNRRHLSRREVLRECLSSGALLVAATWSEEDVLRAWMETQASHAPTPSTVMGPFYKKRAPGTTRLRTSADPGVPLAVTGRVITVHGEPIRDAKIEVWQADDAGRYDLEGYRFRASMTPAASGAYAFDSIIPGHYPARVARHVHYFVTAPGCKPLSTQLYFATDEVFEGKPDQNFKKDPLITSRELVRPVALSGTPDARLASVTFELVLEKV